MVFWSIERLSQTKRWRVVEEDTGIDIWPPPTAVYMCAWAPVCMDTHTDINHTHHTHTKNTKTSRTAPTFHWALAVGKGAYLPQDRVQIASSLVPH